jgi:cell division protein FtsB
LSVRQRLAQYDRRFVVAADDIAWLLARLDALEAENVSLRAEINQLTSNPAGISAWARLGDRALPQD